MNPCLKDINKIRLFVDQTNQELVPIDKFAPKKNKPASEVTLRSFDRLESKLLFEIKKKGNAVAFSCWLCYSGVSTERWGHCGWNGMIFMTKTGI